MQVFQYIRISDKDQSNCSIAAPIEKQELCSHIFASNLYISNRQYRTAKNALLSTLISKKINELETLNLE